MKALTDLEICKHIARIEGLNQVDIRGIVLVSHGFSCDRVFNPLTDDALCFRLIQEYKIWRWSHTGCGEFNVCIKGVQGWVTSVTFNKAICLAIIESHKDV